MKERLLVILLFFISLCNAQSSQNLKLWYKQPAGDTWENALPIGNGRLGGMVYGNVGKETIQLNEHTVWSGGPNRNDNPASLDSLAVIRQLIFDGKQKEAEDIANRIIITRKSHGQMFEPVGSLQFVFDGHDNYTDYYRELDIEKAVSKTSYVAGGIKFTREAFASIPDRVIVMRLTADKPNSISFTASLSTPQPKATVATTALRELTIAGTTIDHEGVKGLVKFKGIVRIKPEGGVFTSNDTSLVIKNANAATIYISIATNFNSYHDVSGNENKRAADFLNKAYAKSYSVLLRSHVSAYQKYFGKPG